MKWMRSVYVCLCLAGLLNAEEVKSPKLEVISAARVDFGKYNAWEKKVASYAIKNAGNADLKIISIHKTCGCASATTSKSIIKPGEEAAVEVVILPDSIFGAYSKNTFIESDDPNSKLTCVNVSGQALPFMEIKPSEGIYLGRIPTNSIITQSFELSSTVSGIKLGDPKLDGNREAEATLTSLDAQRSLYKLNVVTKQLAQSGDVRLSLMIPVVSPTNHASLKLSISAKIGDELCIIPGILRLPVSDTPLQRTVTLRILGKPGMSLDPASITLPEYKGVTCKTKKDISGLGVDVDMTFEPAFTKDLFANQVLTLDFGAKGLSSAGVVFKTKK